MLLLQVIVTIVYLNVASGFSCPVKSNGDNVDFDSLDVVGKKWNIIGIARSSFKYTPFQFPEDHHVKVQIEIGLQITPMHSTHRLLFKFYCANYISDFVATDVSKKYDFETNKTQAFSRYCEGKHVHAWNFVNVKVETNLLMIYSCSTPSNLETMAVFGSTSDFRDDYKKNELLIKVNKWLEQFDSSLLSKFNFLPKFEHQECSTIKNFCTHLEFSDSTKKSSKKSTSSGPTSYLLTAALYGFSITLLITSIKELVQYIKHKIQSQARSRNVISVRPVNQQASQESDSVADGNTFHSQHM